MIQHVAFKADQRLAIMLAPPAGGQSWGIAAGPDGALWITLYSNAIERVTTSAVTDTYVLPTPAAGPEGITTGADGALWFTESAAGQIGRITAAGQITEYPIAAANSAPNQIAAGPDGSLWFTDTSGKIGQVVTTTANLSVTPDSGRYRSPLIFSGSGFTPHENVRVYQQGIGSTVLASATADATGLFSATAESPAYPNGSHLFLCQGRNSGHVGAANFSISAHLALEPDSGAPGSTVTVSGYGFGAAEVVTIHWGDPRAYLGTVAADIHGSFHGNAALTFTVPSGAAAGQNEVIGRGTYTIAAASFTVQ